ncbi:TetR/AcrR family transcriptional regulator [Pseudonocardia sp. KRD291]|uniref:TetR/AcrR family transcriptional regulator n=1 Tax=Pseudonocardia sp. KRD291 TaxID=2792007 RepID=UPI001C49E3C8|nr:TetR/AcrR family transcriptional regulator [Pseudonocardia sp. KRD291]MBW0104631.1 TetR/AcrR family transcriptional regulator [Pseudonocardia sp. KRD291]
MPRRSGRQIAAEQYFAAAMTILARDGAAGLKIGPLCRALGVTSGSFYHHFGSWAGFVRALLQHWEAEQTSRVVEMARATADPVERMEVLKRLTVELPHDSEAAIRAWSAMDTEVGRSQRRVDAQRRMAVEQVIVGVVPDRDVAARLAVLGLSILAGFQQTCSPRDPALLRALFDDYQAMIAQHSGAGLPGSA